MKSYTDIKQSKKLAEILPIESADGTWKQYAICGDALNVPEEMKYIHSGKPERCKNEARLFRSFKIIR